MVGADRKPKRRSHRIGRHEHGLCDGAHVTSDGRLDRLLAWRAGLPNLSSCDLTDSPGEATTRGVRASPDRNCVLANRREVARALQGIQALLISSSGSPVQLNRH